MQNSDLVVNGNIESSWSVQEHRKKDGQGTHAALDDLRLRLNAVIATVARLDRRSQKRQWFSQAEQELLKLLRGEDGEEFAVTISCAKGRWSIVNRSFGFAGLSAATSGEGTSFPEAWHRQDPLWS